MRFSSDTIKLLQIATHVNANISAQSLQDVLSLQHELSNMKVTRSGNCYGYRYGIRHTGDYTDSARIISDSFVVCCINRGGHYVTDYMYIQ